MKIGDERTSWERDPALPMPGGIRREPALYDPSAHMMPIEADLEPEIGVNLMHYFHVLMKWRWVVVGALALSMLFGLAATLLTTPEYKASSTIQIDREVMKVTSKDDGIQPREMGGDEFFQTQYGLLKSRALAEQAVAKFNLADNKAFLDQGAHRSLLRRGPKTLPSQASRADRKEMAIGMVMGGLLVEPVRPSRLVKLTVMSADPKVAADVSNAVADTFMAWNLQRRVDSTAAARNFLKGTLESTLIALQESERKLVEYERANHIIELSQGKVDSSGASGGSTSLVGTNLQALNSAYAQATNERLLAEQRYRQASATAGVNAASEAQSPVILKLRTDRATALSDYQQILIKALPELPEAQRIKARIDQLDKAIAAELKDSQGAALQDLKSKYEIALSQEKSLGAKVEQLKQSFLTQRNLGIQYNILLRDAEQNRAQYADLLERTKEVSVAQSITANNISVVDHALPNGAPFKPRPAINMIVSIAVGLLAGALMALGLEQLDDSIKTPEDIDTKLGVSMLGAIPVLPKGLLPFEALADPRSAVSEAYYSVRTALQFSTSEGVPSNLLVTSARPSEGKSTTAMALAQNFARLGLRTLLIDSDLRNPSLHKVLGRHNSSGLSNLLTGSAQLSEVVQATDDPNLMFVACGPLPPNPAELLAGAKVRSVLQEVAAEFDQVIIDGPPVMGLADAPLLASVAAGTILVIAAGSTRRGLARAALKRLHLSHAKLLGAVLTKFNARRTSYGYGYGYGSAYAYAYDYGAKPDTKQIEGGDGKWFGKRSARGR